MRSVRIFFAVLALAGFIRSSLLWATDNSPSTDDAKSARDACQKIFDQKLDECMKTTAKDPHPVEANFCIDIASQYWKMCLNDHGLDPRQQRPPRMKYGPGGARPQVAPPTPTPRKRVPREHPSIGPIKPTGTATPGSTAKPKPSSTPVLKKKG